MHGQHDPGGAGRRAFLKQLAGGAVAAAAWPGELDAIAARLAAAGPQQGEAFWQQLRNEFLIPEDRLFLNVGTLGPQPRVVVDAVVETTRRVAMTYPPGVEWDELKTTLGRLLHGDAAGFVFPRNTTEGMNFVAHGLELAPGDEVLTTNHEHIGGRCCWELLEARRGVRLRQLPLPVPPTDPAQLVALFEEAFTPSTRVVSVSHVTFTNGVIMPVRAIATLCRERGIICVVDGAHPPGLLSVDLDGMGADFYASSPHKWLLAPQGTGFLYLAEPWRTRLWPTLASGGWDDLELGAHRLNHLGTLDESRLAGLLAALRFHETIGPERIYDRVRFFRERLYHGLEGLPGLELVSPVDAALGAGMVSFRTGAVDALELQRRLARRPEKVRTRVIGEYGLGWMRLSPHMYNSVEQIDRVIELIGEESTR